MGVEPQSWNRICSKAGDKAARSCKWGLSCVWKTRTGSASTKSEARAEATNTAGTPKDKPPLTSWGLEPLPPLRPTLPPAMRLSSWNQSGRFVPSLPGDLKGGTISQARMESKAVQICLGFWLQRQLLCGQIFFFVCSVTIYCSRS